jgi:hypothetical protein
MTSTDTVTASEVRVGTIVLTSDGFQAWEVTKVLPPRNGRVQLVFNYVPAIYTYEPEHVFTLGRAN